MFRVLRRAALPSAAAAAALLMAGCSPQPESAAPTPHFAAGTAATPGMAGMGSMPQMPPMPGMSAKPTAVTPAPLPAGPNAVDIDDFAFVPETVTVKAGTTVTWTNHDEDPHTVVDDNGGFHSPAMGSGATYMFTFPDAGTFAYDCSIHPFMRGTVVVTP